MSEPKGGMWPTAREIALLRAAILGGDEGSDVWRELRSHFASGNEIVAAYPRLAPLLWTQLRKSNVALPNPQPLKAAFVHTWAGNQYLVNKATEAAAALEEDGIESLFLKGVALLPQYPSFGARPMADIDILVHTEDFPNAMKRLESLGWKESFANTEATKRFGHAGLLTDESGNELDLHWRLAPDTIAAPQVEEFWKTSCVENFLASEGKVPAATYQLFHCMSHGLRWSAFPSVQWIADAAFVLNGAEDEIDWGRFIELADLLGRGTVIRQGLRLLARDLGVSIPDHVMRQASPVPRLERREAWFLSHVGPDSKLGGLPDRWYFYRRVASRLDDVAGLRGFWQYLRWRWSPHGGLLRTTFAKIGERIGNPFSNRRAGTSD